MPNLLKIFRCLSLLATLATAHAAHAAVTFAPLLAQVDKEEEEARAYALEVALIMLCIILGLMLTLRPSKRTAEVEKRAPEAD